MKLGAVAVDYDGTIAVDGAFDTSVQVSQELGLSEAALLPGVEESRAQLQRFQIAPRLTAHVRHRAKYGARARSLKELVTLLASVPEDASSRG